MAGLLRSKIPQFRMYAQLICILFGRLHELMEWKRETCPSVRNTGCPCSIREACLGSGLSLKLDIPPVPGFAMAIGCLLRRSIPVSLECTTLPDHDITMMIGRDLQLFKLVLPLRCRNVVSDVSQNTS